MRFWCAALAAVLSTPLAAADIPTVSQIDAVLVFPAGAEVSRAAKLKLAAGEHTLILNDLPAQAVPGSIRVEGRATGGRLEIGSVDSRRLLVPRADEVNTASERRQLEDEIERLKDGRAVLQAQLQTAEAQKAFINNLAKLPTRAPAATAGAGGAREDWSQVLGLIGSGMGEVQRAVLETQVKVREQDRKIKDLEKKLAAVAPAQEERTEVRVFVAAAAPLDAELVIRYQVPGASWSPLYDARLATGSKSAAPRLTLTRRASISQRSGEPWDNVALTLSTTRPAAGSAAPELRTVTVDFEPERPPVPVAAAPPASPRSRDGRMYLEERVQKAAEASPTEAAVEQQARVETAAFQALFAIPGRVSIPNTGEMKRAQLDEDQLEPALVVRTVPKREAKAFLYARLTLPKKTPYLAGPVALFRDQTFVGNGRLPALTPGEEHELGFGADDSVRVRYAVVEEKRGESGLISASRNDQRNFRIAVRNMHERAVALAVVDQIPVSLNQDIKVELLGRTPPTKRDPDDKRGLLVWEDKLGPDEERVIEFGYRITWPAAKAITYGR